MIRDFERTLFRCQKAYWLQFLLDENLAHILSHLAFVSTYLGLFINWYWQYQLLSFFEQLPHVFLVIQ